MNEQEQMQAIDATLDDITAKVQVLLRERNALEAQLSDLREQNARWRSAVMDIQELAALNMENGKRLTVMESLERICVIGHRALLVNPQPALDEEGKR